jgi:hypothetical protein
LTPHTPLDLDRDQLALVQDNDINKANMMRTTLIALALVGMASFAAAECPNACSGHGRCGESDQCSCDRGYVSGDCSHRACPSATAFVTTPQGDRNTDGDLADNSFKRLSFNVMTFPINTHTIIMGGQLQGKDCSTTSFPCEQEEVRVGDALKIGAETFIIVSINVAGDQALADGSDDDAAAHTDGGTGKTMIVVDVPSAIDYANYPVYKFLKTQERPNGDWEIWPGDYHGSGVWDHNEADSFSANVDTTSANDEGHFYMECSNRGMCDRKAGVCECFDGYTGTACHRQACPEGCSGHGVCRSVDDQRWTNPRKFTATFTTVKDSANVFASLAKWADSSVDAKQKIAAGDYLKIGYHRPIRVKTASTNANGERSKIVLEEAFPETLPYGTPGYLVSKYQLWDAEKNFACVCDAGYSGNDCSLRKCPMGDDPLTVHTIGYDTWTAASVTDQDDGDVVLDSDENHYRQSEEFQTLVIANDNAKYPVTGTFKLTFTDQFGDEWTTRDIPTQVRLSVPASLASQKLTFFCQGAGGGIAAVEQYGDGMASDGNAVTAAAQSASTGSGSGATATFTPSAAGVASGITIPAAGTGYKVGDLVAFPHVGTGSPVTTFIVTAIATSSVTCEEDEGLPKEELSVGDFVKVGNDIAKVNAVTYQVKSSKTSTKAYQSVDLDLTSSGFTAHSTNMFGYAYRISVQKEIREALQAIPNQRIEGVAVQYLNYYRTAITLGNAVTATAIPTASPVVEDDEGFLTSAGGEQIRFAIAGSGTAVVLAMEGRGVADTHTIGWYNTQKYRIRFKTGCSDDSHCNNNGKNTLMSDTSAKCNHGGFCVCNPGLTVDDAYFGHGCTSDGKGDHSAPYKRSNSGDLPLLRCDKSQLTSSRQVGVVEGGDDTDTAAGKAVVGHVTMADNTKIITTDISGASSDATNAKRGVAIGDQVRMGDQIRTVIATNAAWLRVDRPFTKNRFSDFSFLGDVRHQFIFPRTTLLDHVKTIGGSQISCTVTDIIQLTSTTGVGITHADGNVNALTTTSKSIAQGSTTTLAQINVFDKVTMDAGTLQDIAEVNVGDRIRLVHDTNDWAQWKTRTVDKVDLTAATTTTVSSVASFTVDLAYGASADTNVRAYNDQRGTTEEASCSKRGLCDESSGTCQCFKGYTDDDCSRQNALAA